MIGDMGKMGQWMVNDLWTSITERSKYSAAGNRVYLSDLIMILLYTSLTSKPYIVF